jgi:sporulation protein YlmC with PRC-barrel domain
VLKKVKDLESSTIHATDGDVGRVRTVLFDDERWTVRYLVAETGRWLSGRRVLLSPISVDRVRWADGAIDVGLSREQVKNSPDITTDVPVSRQRELEFYRYYGYPHYWGGAGIWGAGAYPAMLAHADDQRGMAHAAVVFEQSGTPDTHLRDASVVAGYGIAAADGDIGRVDDFLFDDRTWTIRYLVVDTSRWLGGRHVIVSPEWVTDVSWGESAVHVALTREAIKASPEYDPRVGIAREYERRLHEHYGRHGYWDEDAGRDVPELAALEDLEHLQVAGSDRDVRGWEVVAADGRAVGSVAHLIVDPAALKVRYLDVVVRTSPSDQKERDELVPIEEVDLDVPSEQVRVRALSTPDLHALPRFGGLPIEADYERRLRSHFVGSTGHR